MRIIIIETYPTENAAMLESIATPISDSDARAPHDGRERASRELRTDSHRLLAGGRELVIDHAGQQYRLRLTRNDKLILTK
jgi:hemin uptake protein HemP